MPTGSPRQAASTRASGYQPSDADEPERWLGVRIDWRAFLDLLELHNGETYDDVWREQIIDDAGAAELDARTTARDAYEALLADAGDWALPSDVRPLLALWSFDDATVLMAEVEDVLAARDALAASEGADPITALGRVGSDAAAAVDAAREALAADKVEQARTLLDEARAADAGSVGAGWLRLGLGGAALAVVAGGGFILVRRRTAARSA